MPRYPSRQSDLLASSRLYTFLVYKMLFLHPLPFSFLPKEQLMPARRVDQYEFQACQIQFFIVHPS